MRHDARRDAWGAEARLHKQALAVRRMYALSNGYLLSAIILSSMLVHIIDGNFYSAALWLLFAAGASHARTSAHTPMSASKLHSRLLLLDRTTPASRRLLRTRNQRRCLHRGTGALRQELRLLASSMALSST